MRKVYMDLSLIVAGLCAVGGFYCFPVFAQDKAEFNVLTPVSYASCEDSKYYDGYGVEALDTPDLSDYVASYEIDGSSLCFNVDSPSSLRTLKIVWYSEAEAPKSLEIIGYSQNSGKTLSEVLWTKDSPVVLETMAGSVFSEFKLNSEKTFTRFRINYVVGGAQGRLLVRAVAPFFYKQFEGEESKLLSDSFRISGTAPYGLGVATIKANDVDELAKELKAQDSLHCGNYSYLLAYELADRHKWTAYGAISKMNASHTVVELEYGQKKYTADPTLGALYLCSYSDMQGGVCDFSKAIYTDKYNPVMWRYKGRDFYPGATIQGSYSELQAYYDSYRKLD